MISLDTYYQKPTLSKDIKQVRKSFAEYWDYRNYHTEITSEKDWKNYTFDTIFIYSGCGIYVDLAMGVWREETYQEYVERTGDLS